MDVWWISTGFPLDFHWIHWMWWLSVVDGKLQHELSCQSLSSVTYLVGWPAGLSSPKQTHVLSRRCEAYAIGLSAIGHLTRTGYL